MTVKEYNEVLDQMRQVSLATRRVWERELRACSFRAFLVGIWVGIAIGGLVMTALP